MGDWIVAPGTTTVGDPPTVPVLAAMNPTTTAVGCFYQHHRNDSTFTKHAKLKVDFDQVAKAANVAIGHSRGPQRAWGKYQWMSPLLPA